MSLHGEHGAARRRRQRRLRSWWRHEQQSVAMALSAAAHHSYTELHGDWGPGQQGKRWSSSCSTKTPWGVRPRVLAEPRPQERVQRHTLEHIVDFVCCSLMVQILDAPVPQMVEQLPDVLRFFDRLATVREQAIEVPKIFIVDVPMRAVLRATQLAEQLVEVPTIVSYSSLQRNLEQSVNIPVPGRGGRIAGLQDFLPRQSPTALHGSQERISERIVEQNVDFAVGGGLQDFLPGQSSSASSSSPAGFHGSADGPGAGLFLTFPELKKVRSPPRARVWGCPPVAAHGLGRLMTTMRASM